MPHASPPERLGSRATLGGDLLAAALFLVLALGIGATLRWIFTAAPTEQVGVSPNGCPITYVDLRRRGDAFVLICPKGARP